MWVDALERANSVSTRYSHFIWNEIINQARQHPVQIRDTYKIATFSDDAHYIKRWMNFAGRKNVNIEMPKILKNDLLTKDVKNHILSYWKKIFPDDYEDYLASKAPK